MTDKLHPAILREALAKLRDASRQFGGTILKEEAEALLFEINLLRGLDSDGKQCYVVMESLVPNADIDRPDGLTKAITHQDNVADHIDGLIARCNYKSDSTFTIKFTIRRLTPDEFRDFGLNILIDAAKT